MTRQRKLLWIFAYDVVDDRRRLKVMTELLEAGVRVNYSVFECRLTEGEASVLAERISRHLSPKADVLLAYPLCSSCQSRSIRFGAGVRADEPILHVD